MSVVSQNPRISVPLAAGGSSSVARRVPIATLGLVILNSIAFFLNLAASDTVSKIFLLDPDGPGLHQFITFGFFHFGWVQYFCSVALFIVISPALEEALGAPVILGLYAGISALSGVGYLILTMIEHGTASLPGGSLAVSGMLGVYFLLGIKRRGQVDVFIPVLGRVATSVWVVFALLALWFLPPALFAAFDFYDNYSWGVAALHPASLFAGASLLALVTQLYRSLLTLPSPASAPSPESSVHDRLVREVAKEEGTEEPAAPVPPAPVIAGPMATLNMGPRSDDAKGIIQCIDTCDAIKAYRLFRGFAGMDGEACLDLENQWRMAQLMLGNDMIDAAIDVLKRLLRRFPYGFCSAQAQYELGLLYTSVPGMRDQALEYLLSSLKPPPTHIPAHIARLRRPLSEQARRHVKRTLTEMGVTDYPEGTWETSGSPDAESNLPAGEPVNLTDIFGKADATGAFAPQDWDVEPPPKKGSVPPPSKKEKDKPREKETQSARPASHPEDDALPMMAEPKKDATDESKPKSVTDVFGSADSSQVQLPPDWGTGTGSRRKPAPPTKPKPRPKYDDSADIKIDGVADKTILESHGPTPTPQPPSKGMKDIFGQPDSTAAQVPPQWDATGKSGVGRISQPPPSPKSVESGNVTPIQLDKESKGEGVIDFPTPPPFGAAHPVQENTSQSLTPPPTPAPASSEREEWGSFFSDENIWGRKRDASHVEPPPIAPLEPRIGSSRPPTTFSPSSLPPASEPPVAPTRVEPQPAAKSWIQNLPPGPSSEEEIFFAQSGKDQTLVWSRYYADDRQPRFQADSRYSVIVAPASMILVKEVIEVLQEFLGMNSTGVIHALKRRHGILAGDLSAEEANQLATRFADHGQDVALVEQDERLDFGEPRDVLRITYEDRRGKFWTTEGMVARKWKELVGMGCGQTVVKAGGAPRDVLDLYFAQPGLHLRIWRNTLMSAPPAFSGKLDNEREFQALAREFARLAPHAIQTNTFFQWTQGNDPNPPGHFAGLIEYDNYTQWYLMAHYGRSKFFGAKSSVS